MIEIMGSEHVRIDMNPKVRTKSQDWRISNIFWLNSLVKSTILGTPIFGNLWLATIVIVC